MSGNPFSGKGELRIPTAAMQPRNDKRGGPTRRSASTICNRCGEQSLRLAVAQYLSLHKGGYGLRKPKEMAATFIVTYDNGQQEKEIVDVESDRFQELMRIT